jgi:hypothetical protein
VSAAPVTPVTPIVTAAAAAATATAATAAGVAGTAAVVVVVVLVQVIVVAAVVVIVILVDTVLSSTSLWHGKTESLWLPSAGLWRIPVLGIAPGAIPLRIGSFNTHPPKTVLKSSFASSLIFPLPLVFLSLRYVVLGYSYLVVVVLVRRCRVSLFVSLSLSPALTFLTAAARHSLHLGNVPSRYFLLIREKERDTNTAHFSCTGNASFYARLVA